LTNAQTLKRKAAEYDEGTRVVEKRLRTLEASVKNSASYKDMRKVNKMTKDLSNEVSALERRIDASLTAELRELRKTILSPTGEDHSENVLDLESTELDLNSWRETVNKEIYTVRHDLWSLEDRDRCPCAENDDYHSIELLEMKVEELETELFNATGWHSKDIAGLRKSGDGTTKEVAELKKVMVVLETQNKENEVGNRKLKDALEKVQAQLVQHGALFDSVIEALTSIRDFVI
jgi:hypothetical protein